ncbi:asparagine-rich protein-like [Galleria mellonella]|uniref:Asparagine-rich protein-like n=1 Tax=Galleria mellonella TaxID=7137 RepID=A0ABM3MJW5_GALME|nr:asparagine-rich protein-like [Galleria mellonella]
MAFRSSVRKNKTPKKKIQKRENTKRLKNVCFKDDNVAPRRSVRIRNANSQTQDPDEDDMSLNVAKNTNLHVDKNLQPVVVLERINIDDFFPKDSDPPSGKKKHQRRKFKNIPILRQEKKTPKKKIQKRENTKRLKNVSSKDDNVAPRRSVRIRNANSQTQDPDEDDMSLNVAKNTSNNTSKDDATVAKRREPHNLHVDKNLQPVVVLERINIDDFFPKDSDPLSGKTKHQRRKFKNDDNVAPRRSVKLRNANSQTQDPDEDDMSLNVAKNTSNNTSKDDATVAKRREPHNLHVDNNLQPVIVLERINIDNFFPKDSDPPSGKKNTKEENSKTRSVRIRNANSQTQDPDEDDMSLNVAKNTSNNTSKDDATVAKRREPHSEFRSSVRKNKTPKKKIQKRENTKRLKNVSSKDDNVAPRRSVRIRNANSQTQDPDEDDMSLNVAKNTNLHVDKNLQPVAVLERINIDDFFPKDSDPPSKDDNVAPRRSVRIRNANSQTQDPDEDDMSLNVAKNTSNNTSKDDATVAKRREPHNLHVDKNLQPDGLP